MKVILIGCGLGNPDTLTVGAQRALAESDLIIGAERLVEPYQGGAAEVLALTRAADIEDALRSRQFASACILMSGDVGFYSGATTLYPRLEGFDVQVIPGISSVVYFTSQLHTTWQDAHLVSAHGRACNAAGEVRTHKKTFLLTGGTAKVRDICQELSDAGLGDVQVAVGERLSYPDEAITRGTAQKLAQRDFHDLSVMLVENPAPVVRAYQAPSLTDEDFLRGKAPMTKEEVRQLALCKLRIKPAHTLWDVGAGTGSVTCEMALAATEGRVYAIERNHDALALMEQNAANLGLSNVTVVPGLAPEACENLPAPDRVFIGGSAGQMKQIFQCALSKNPAVRMVVTAITLETVAEALACVKECGMDDADIVSVTVAKSKEVGSYHMMMGNNPVYVIACQRAAEAD